MKYILDKKTISEVILVVSIETVTFYTKVVNLNVSERYFKQLRIKMLLNILEKT